MLILKSIICVLCVLSIATVFADAPKKLVKTDFTSWDGTDAAKFGCFIEKEFGVKDKKFNCALKKYENMGDACKTPDVYAEGPVFPTEKVKLVDSRFESIELGWEHCDLQNITVTLNKKYTEKEVRKIFHLTEKADIQDCSLKNTCIVYTAFDHMGAGDVDCGDDGGAK